MFIDGSAGTTGLRIFERIGARSDIELLSLSDEGRKNHTRRKEALNSCDIAFLCLPDAAATEAVAMIENPDVTVIDTSTAHRTLRGLSGRTRSLSATPLRDTAAAEKR